MQETSRFENEVTLGGKWDGWTRTESELALPRAEEDGFMEDLEEDPAEEDRCAPGGKKTQPKKTTFSNRLNYRTFRMAMTAIDVVRMPTIDQLVEAVVFDVPTAVAQLDDSPG